MRKYKGYGICKKVIAWLLMVVMGVNSFGQHIPIGMGTVHAMDYEKGSEEAEETIRAAEKAAGIGLDEEKTDETETTDDSVSEKTESVNTSEEDSQVLQNSDNTDGIDWKEFSVDGDIIEGDYANQEAIRLTSNLLIKGSLGICKPIDLNGYMLTVEGQVTQMSDLIVNGNFIINSGYIWTDGNITFNGGYVDIAGDLQQEKQASCMLSMEHQTDYLLVEGDITLNEYSKLTTNITDGIIELRGDFTQKVSVSSQNIFYSEGDFYAGGNSKLLLSGDNPQNIYVAKETSGFKNITVDTAGLKKDEKGNYLFENRRIGFSGQCNYEVYEDCGCPTTYGYAVFNPQKFKSYIIYGSCYFNEESWHLNSELIVIGDFIQNGDMYMEGGNLKVYGDYRIQSIDVHGEYGETEGKLVTQRYSSNYIYGDFVTQSSTDHTGLLTNGYWHIYGGIYQYGKETKNFVTSDSFKIYINNINLSQSRECHIVMDNPLDNPINYLYTYSSNIKIVIEKGACISQNSHIGEYSGYVIIKDVTSYSYYHGDVRILSDANISAYLDISGDLVVDADMTATASRISVGGDMIVNANVSVAAGLEVKKDIIVKQGVFTIDGGYVTADDVCFQDGSNSTLVMEKASSRISCKEFYYGSNHKSGKLTNGNIQFTGNFYVKDTGTPDSFVCSDKHVVTACRGGDFYEITIENPASNIETLQVNCGGTVRSTAQTVIHKVINSGPYYVWEGTEGYTLERDEVCNEDFLLACGTLDLNGHTLTVNGDFNAGQGKVYIHGGNLVVKGNLNLAYRNWQDGRPEIIGSRADIIMDNENDRVDIAGDIYAILSSDSLKGMEKGDVYLSGDIKIEGTIGEYKYSHPSAMNGVNLHFVGNRKQVITAPNDNILLKVGNFMALGTQEISVEIPIRVNGILQLPKQYKFCEMTIQDLGKIEDGTFKGNITAYKSTLKNDVHIEGDLTFQEKSDLCGYNIYADKMTVNSEIYLSGGGIYVNELYMNSMIYMQDAKDVIETKDLYVDVNTKNSDYMTEGNIYVTGNFTDNTNKYYAFLPSGNHTIVFMVPAGETASITFNNEKTLLNRAVFNNRLTNYSINRKKEKIAKELVAGYDDQEKPETPEPVTCYENTGYLLMLQWSEVTDNMDVNYYKLYRDGVYIGKTDELRYIDMGLKPNTIYRYSVSAVDMLGNESDLSKEANISTYCDNEAPKINSIPSIKAEEGSITINCKDAFYDRETYVDYYILTKDGKEIAHLTESASSSYRDWDGNYMKIQVQKGNPVYEENGYEYGERHEYCLYAVDAAGNVSKGYTMQVTGNYQPPIPTGFYVESKNGYNIIYFDKTDNGECSSYRVYRDGKYITSFSNDLNFPTCKAGANN